MEKQLRELEKAASGLRKAIGSVELALEDKVEFGFTIFEQPGDGFVLTCDEDDMLNAPLSFCVDIIRKKGKLSLKDYKTLTI